ELLLNFQRSEKFGAGHGEHSVRAMTNENMPNDLMFVLGEKYPARAVTRDIGFVCAAFNEFAETGNVSTDMLS
ncbi:DUF6911 family protein, partial [Herbaspirillum sp. B65]|uniref:DUF6911 family protein n=1 Tax=Herbaspirillum sp. B65 TaxID=137708 RepID=UPI003F886DF4